MIHKTLLKEAYFRIIVPHYAMMPKSGMGAATQGGRYNRQGQEALYLSLDAPTAMAEYQQDNPFMSPGTICTFFVEGLVVADISAGYDPKQWPPLWADYQVDWRALRFGSKIEPPTWFMGDDVINAGLAGILFPSQARLGGTNLVIFNSSGLPDEHLQVHDPDGLLAKIEQKK